MYYHLQWHITRLAVQIQRIGIGAISSSKIDDNHNIQKLKHWSYVELKIKKLEVLLDDLCILISYYIPVSKIYFHAQAKRWSDVHCINI